MAIDSETARLFLACHKAGLRFGHVLMLGRQNVLTRPAETVQLFRSYGLEPDQRLLDPDAYEKPPFAEPFFHALGATTCESMDYSAYEGATLLHNLNEPISAELREKHDLVFDGGTLEHVFNFPQALHNAMQMVKPGGWYAAFTPGNNWFGHGFYQFSPELYYRALSPQNGFAKCAVFMVPEGFGLKWYLVSDPLQSQMRTNLITSLRTPLLVLAHKTQSTPEKLLLQQSDYEAYWDRNTPVLNTGKIHRESNLELRLKRFLYRNAPLLTRRLATLEARPWSAEYKIRRRDVFRPVSQSELPSMIAELKAS